MFSGTRGLGGDLSGTRGGDVAGVFDVDGRGDRAVSTCSSGTLPAKAAEAGLRISC